MSRDTFSLLSEREQAARLTAKRTLGEHMSGILLGICLVLTAVLPLVVLRLVNPFSEGFLIRTAYTALTSTLTYLLFIPEGKRAEWRHNSALTEAQDRLRALSSMVRAGHRSKRSARPCFRCPRRTPGAPGAFARGPSASASAGSPPPSSSSARRRGHTPS